MDWRAQRDDQQQSLESILAHRDSSRRLLMQLAQDAEQKKTRERQFGLDEEVRKGTLARQVAQDKTTAEDRDETRKVNQQARDLATVKMIPRGTRITSEDDIARVQSAGLGSRLKAQFKQVPMPNAGDVGPVDAPPIPDGQEFMGTSDQLVSDEKAMAAQERADAIQAQREVQNTFAEGRANNAAGAADLARARLQFDRDRDAAKPPRVLPKTPAEIQADSAARAAGTAQGKAGAQPLGAVQKIIDGIMGPDGIGGSGRMPAVPAHTPTATSGASAAVHMVTPDGRTINVPADKVPEAVQRGARQVQ